MSQQSELRLSGSYNTTHPWVVAYPGLGTEEYLTTEDYEKIIGDFDKADFVPVSGGRVLSTRFQKLVKNPNYVNRERVALREKREEFKREYAGMKAQGIFEKIEDFLDWKREMKLKETKENEK